MTGGFGKAKYGVAKYGEGDLFAELSKKRWFVAQKQLAKTIIYRYYSRKRLQQAYRYVVPNNPMTPAQQANRMKFASAMASWAALTPAQQAAYEHRARDKKCYGKNIFVKEYMLTP